MSLSLDFLLRGAFYSMEQAWHLLQDGVLLFQRGRYSSSLVLSVYCLEEMGRAEICLRERERALTSAEVTVKDLRDAYTKHKLKLGQGQITVTVCCRFLLQNHWHPIAPKCSSSTGGSSK